MVNISGSKVNISSRYKGNGKFSFTGKTAGRKTRFIKVVDYKHEDHQCLLGRMYRISFVVSRYNAEYRVIEARGLVSSKIEQVTKEVV